MCVGSENSVWVRNLYKYKNDSMVYSRFFCFITLCASIHSDSHWWRTIQCAANSFSRGTSNRAGSKSSSRAVGLTLGSLSRHFWINSYKPPHKIWSHVTGKMFHIHKQNIQSIWFDPWPPSAVGPLVAVWHCWWRPEKHKRTLHSHGFPGAPSTHISTHGHMYSGFTGEASGRSSRQISPPKHTCQMNRYLLMWWYYHLKWGKCIHNTVTIEKNNNKKKTH